MHRATFSLLLLLASSSGCINREGTFSGELQQESSLRKDGTSIEATAPKTTSVETKASDGIQAQVDGCSLTFDETGTAEMVLRSGQTCNLTVGSYQGEFDMSGEGGVDRSSSILSLQLVGNPKDLAVEGTVKITFTGNRQ